jgi:hypothetical protein
MFAKKLSAIRPCWSAKRVPRLLPTLRTSSTGQKQWHQDGGSDVGRIVVLVTDGHQPRKRGYAAVSRNSRNRSKHRNNRKTAMRLAVFLDAIGLEPDCEGQNWTQVLQSLSNQYQSLPVELKRDARLRGRMLIREEGLTEIAAAILSGPPPTPPKPQRPRTPGRTKCSFCRTWDFKSIWNTREDAERFSLQSKDLSLHAYKCPHGNGWHLGHCRKALDNPTQAASG